MRELNLFLIFANITLATIHAFLGNYNVAIICAGCAVFSAVASTKRGS